MHTVNRIKLYLNEYHTTQRKNTNYILNFFFWFTEATTNWEINYTKVYL